MPEKKTTPAQSVGALLEPRDEVVKHALDALANGCSAGTQGKCNGVGLRVGPLRDTHFATWRGNCAAAFWADRGVLGGPQLAEGVD